MVSDFMAQVGGGTGPVDWLSADPISGTVVPAGTQAVTLGFDATGLEVGAYMADLIIDNNSATTPVVVPVTMIVGSNPNPTIIFNPASLEETHSDPPQTTTQIVTVTNIGEQPLTFDAEVYINNPGPDVVVDPEAYAEALAARQALEGYTGYGEMSAIFTPGEVQYSDAPYDLQFEYPCAVATGEAGVETDGSYIYTTLWNGTEFCKYEMDGTYVETFGCGSAAAVRDLAYDGTYFYGGAAANTVWEMDFDSQIVVSTISAPVATRAIAYDAGEDGFWANNWSDSPTLYDRSGATLNSFSINGDESFYGFAYMDNDLGICLWGNAQYGSGNMLRKYDLPSGTFVEEFDMTSILSIPAAGDIAGGLYMHPDIEQGYWTLGGIVQNKCLWGVEMGETGPPLTNDVGVLSISEPVSGIDLTATEPITIVIKNFGTATQSDIPYEVTWDGGNYSGTLASLAGQTTEEITLPVTADLSAYGDYSFEACTSLSGDENPNNDCKSKTVTNDAPSLCIDGLYTSGCSYGDGLTSWDFADVNVPDIQCDGVPYDWYHDFTNMTHTLEAGVTYTLTATGGYNNTWLDVWIDFNDDLFCDDNELILNDVELAEAGITYTFDVTIPAGAAGGAHVLRYRTNWQAAVPGSCDALTYGMVSDFTAQLGESEPWLSIDETSGTLNQNESMEIEVTFNSQGLDNGTYTGGITFTSNDPNSPHDLPVTLNVGGTNPPDIEVNPDSFEFLMYSNETDTKVMGISNLGGDMLDYTLTIQYTSDAANAPVPQERPANFDATNGEASPIAFAPVNYTPTDAPYDLQFEYAAAVATGEAGIETDGNYMYTTLWNGTEFCKYEMDGTYVETFGCGSAAAIRDLAYDGTYFYGGAASTTVFEMDFNTQQVISTISAPVATRAIAYDAGEDGFWANNWSDSPTLYDRSGSTLNSFNINGDESFYGFAYMNNDLGVALFGNSQAGSGNLIKKYDLPSGSFVSDFDMTTILSLPVAGDIAGGLFMHENIIPGTWTLGGLVQNVALWGVEMGIAEGPVMWLSVDPASGSVAGGDMDEVNVIANTSGFGENEFYYATIKVASNDPDTPLVEVPVTLELITGISEYEDAYIMMYPNPAKSIVNISTNYELNNVTIINQLGQVVINQQVMGGTVQVNTSQLQKGIYFVKINSVAGESTHKLIIQ
jgi:hypothetical protein